MNIDPLRLRMRFMEALDPAQRRATIEDALEQMREYLKHIEAEALRHEAECDPFSYLVGRGAVLSVRAQIAWLREARKLI